MTDATEATVGGIDGPVLPPGTIRGKCAPNCGGGRVRKPPGNRQVIPLPETSDTNKRHDPPTPLAPAWRRLRDTPAHASRPDSLAVGGSPHGVAHTPAMQRSALSAEAVEVEHEVVRRMSALWATSRSLRYRNESQANWPLQPRKSWPIASRAWCWPAPTLRPATATSSSAWLEKKPGIRQILAGHDHPDPAGQPDAASRHERDQQGPGTAAPQGFGQRQTPGQNPPDVNEQPPLQEARLATAKAAPAGTLVWCCALSGT
jgi:hypothetical protein